MYRRYNNITTMSNKLNIGKQSKKQSNIERIAVLERMVTLNYKLIKDLYEALGSKEGEVQDEGE